MQFRHHLLAILIGLALPAETAAAPKSTCSLRCESIRSPTDSALDRTGISATNKRLQSELVVGTAVGWSVHMLGVTVSGIPFVGPLVEEGFEWEARTIKEGTVRQVTRALEADVRKRLSAGASAESLQTGLSQNAVATIRDLIGPNSAYPDFAADKTAYDALQDQAIDFLASKIEGILASAASGELYSNETRNEIQQNLRSLKSLQGSIEQQKADFAAAKFDPDRANAAMNGPQTAAAKQAAVLTELDSQYKALAAKAESASNQFKAAATILNNIGAPSDSVAIASKLSVLASVVAGYAESQYNPSAILPTIAAVTSLFGGGATQGPDPHLEAILASLDQLHIKVDALRTETLSYHVSEMAEIGRVQTGLVGLVGVLERDKEKELTQCLELIPQAIAVGESHQTIYPEYAFSAQPGYGYGSGTILNALQLRPTTYTAVESLWLERAEELKACRGALGKLYTLAPGYQDLPKQFVIIDIMKEVEAGKTTLPSNIANDNALFHEKYSATLAVMQWVANLEGVVERSRTLSLGASRRNVLAWSLTQPARTVAELQAKANDLDATVEASFSSSKYDEARASEFDHWIAGPAVDADLVARTASYVLLTAWWREFVDAKGLRDPDKLNDKAAVDVLRLLTRTSDLLRLAVAQQGSLSGDVLLLLAADRLEARSIPRYLGASPGLENDASDQLRVARNVEWWTGQASHDFDHLILQNTLFGANLGLVFAGQRLKANGVDLVQYEVAWAMGPNPYLLAQYLGSAPGVYVHQNGRWYIERAWEEPSSAQGGAPVRQVALIPLPTPEELRDGALHHTASLRVAATLLGQAQREAGLYAFAPSDAAVKDQAISTARARALPF